MSERPRKRIDIIRDLVQEGVLGPELCPDPDYWHWPVLRADLVPESLEVYGDSDYGYASEVRWYGE
jgi:hypothetical protein